MKHSLSLLRRTSLSAIVLGGVALAAATASAQTFFSSGSTGADGPLTFTAPLPGDPPVEQVIDMSAKPDGIWNYTSVNIPAGVKVSFTKNTANTGVIWLATGDVNIAGEVNLDGANPNTTSVARGVEAPGGPGGFAGGRGGRRFDVSGSYSGTPGEGPGGGLPGTNVVNPEGGTYGAAGWAGLFPPLLGGSGGGGSVAYFSDDGNNGGGGGGAILVASSGTIRVDGSIHATGGSTSTPTYAGFGSGSGGAIRLVANRIEGNGLITAVGGGGNGGPGRIKTEAFVFQLTNLTNPIATEDRPVPTCPTDLGSIRITSIAGQVVPLSPGGNTASPDVIFSQAGPITVYLATTNIPQGTPLTVRVATVGQVIIVPNNLVNSAGNASATLTVPAGFGTIQAYAEYMVTP